MGKPPIWIVTGKLNFENLFDGDIDYISGWKCIVENWLLEPAHHISNTRSGTRATDRGISLLMLVLAFFEPLGSILSGKSSDGASEKTFVKGFDYFCNWLRENGEDFKIEPNLVYKFARCGLMHSFTMQGGQIFIDAIGVGKTSMCEHNFVMKHTKPKSGGISGPEKIYLIDPWRLLPQVERFCDIFCDRLRKSKDENTDLYLNFKKTFERTIVDPGKVYFS